MWQELDEWIVQATEWTIGAVEAFHYFFVNLLWRNYYLPGIAYFWWFVYYSTHSSFVPRDPATLATI
jgi:hypothetical protein